MNQKHFDELFANIAWADAVALLTGEQELSPERKAALVVKLNKHSMPFVPSSVGHIGFALSGHPQEGTTGQLILIPGNSLIRKRINNLRRSDLAAALKINKEGADFLYTEVSGWQPAIDYLISMFDIFKKNPKISDNELISKHDTHFGRRGQKRAIRALREYFNKNQQPAY